MSIFETIKKTLTSNAYQNLHCFPFKRNQIQIIEKPNEFYSQLKAKISNAQSRIFIASLYVGKKEADLLKCIHDAMNKNQNLKLYFLVDGLRGTRESPNPCSASLLAQLSQKFGERVDIRCYMAPKYFHATTKLLPKRINEGVGLQHMKIYGIDDDIILSGANLSNDYFTDRQDRYYVFKNNHKFSSYYFDLHQMVSKLSYKVIHDESKAKFKLIWPSNNLAKCPRTHQKEFLEDAAVAAKTFLTQKPHNIQEHDESHSTYVFPVSQLTPLFASSAKDYSTEKNTVVDLFNTLNKEHIPYKWNFTTGYFSMHPEIKSVLVDSSKNPSVLGNIITASSYANGFYKSKGLSGMLPEAYNHLVYKFMKAVNKSCSNITVSEWKRGEVNTPNGWSYHAKGIWISPNTTQEEHPIVATIGSSNYTTRAYTLDLESDCIVLTKCDALRMGMMSELENIKKYSHNVELKDFKENSDKHVSVHVKILTNLMKNKL